MPIQSPVQIRSNVTVLSPNLGFFHSRTLIVDELFSGSLSFPHPFLFFYINPSVVEFVYFSVKPFSKSQDFSQESKAYRARNFPT